MGLPSLKDSVEEGDRERIRSGERAVPEPESEPELPRKAPCHALTVAIL